MPLIVERTLFLFSSLFLFVVMGLSGCVSGPPPVLEYTLAKVALDEAKNAGALRYASGLFQQADSTCQKAKSFYSDKHYAEAKVEFNKCKNLAEKAENISRLTRAKTGEIF